MGGRWTGNTKWERAGGRPVCIHHYFDFSCIRCTLGCKEWTGKTKWGGVRVGESMSSSFLLFVYWVTGNTKWQGAEAGNGGGVSAASLMKHVFASNIKKYLCLTSTCDRVGASALTNLTLLTKICRSCHVEISARSICILSLFQSYLVCA